MDSNHKKYLSVVLQNKGNSAIAISNLPEFSDISFNIYKEVTNTYFLIEQRPKQDPLSALTSGGSHSIALIHPSQTVSWEIPLDSDFHLTPGNYRVDIAVDVSLKVGSDFPPATASGTTNGTLYYSVIPTFQFTISTGPIDFRITTKY